MTVRPSFSTLFRKFFPRLLMRKKAREKRIREQALNLYRRYAARIKTILGVKDIPRIQVKVSKKLTGASAATSGTLVTLSYKHFSETEDDGAIIHEYAHAMHRCPRYDDETSWLIEGIADYIRDILDFQTKWSYPHFEKDKALAGY